MSFRTHSRVSRIIAAMSLAAYAGFGVLGHGLHVFLPCADAACHDHDHASVGHQHCCGHHHGPKPAANDDSPAYRASGHGHDEATCSLCGVLAKINVGYAAVQVADARLELVQPLAAPPELRLGANLALPPTARGPPLA